MKAAGRLVLMYLMLAGSLGLVSLYVGCVHGHRGIRPAMMNIDLLRGGKSFEQASPDFRFAAAVASFGMILKDSPNKGKTKLADVIREALAAKGEDEYSTRAEFVSLARLAQEIKRK